MAKSPNWNYWLEERDGERLITYDRPDDESDIRHKRYDLDVVRWCDKPFWTAEEAALISFYRDPEKVAKAGPESDPLHMDDDDLLYEQHNELMSHMSRLHDLVVDAQKAGQLAKNFFPATNFIEWAKLMGIAVPQTVLHQLRFVDQERRQILGLEEAVPLTIFDAARYGRRPSPSRTSLDEVTELSEVSKKGAGPRKRLDKNVTKLILALLIMSCTRFRRHRVRCFMEQEVRHGAKAVYTGVQA